MPRFLTLLARSSGMPRMVLHRHGAPRLIACLALTCLFGALSASPQVAQAVTADEARSAAGWIGAGAFHSLARTNDGAVIAWGDNSDGQGALFVDAGVARVAAGAQHSLVLKSDGVVVASGLDSYGQCQVPADLIDVVAVAAGEEHSLALRSDGTVVAWGANTYGQSSVPAGLKGVVAIAAGGFHSLALKSDGTVVAWGANGNGQSTVPPALGGIVGISAGGFHSLALGSNGTVTGWGRDSEAQRTPPAGLSDVVAVSAGWRHSLALKSNGKVVAWGGGGVESSVVVPAGLSDVVAISAGWRHSLALRSDGVPIGWGLNTSGQCLGPVAMDPTPYSKDIPTVTAFRIAYNAPISAGSAYGQVRLEDNQGGAVQTTSNIDGAWLTVTPVAPLRTDMRYVLRLPAGALADHYGTLSGGGVYYYFTPETLASSHGVPKYSLGFTEIPLTAQSKSGGPGVAGIEYRVNGGTVTIINGASGTGRVTAGQRGARLGNNEFEYRAIDTAGNKPWKWNSVSVRIKDTALAFEAPSTADYAHAAVSGTLRYANTAGVMVALTNHKVMIQQYVGGSWKTISTPTTDSKGRYSATLKPVRRATYRARFEVPGPHLARSSAQRVVLPRASLSRPTFRTSSTGTSRSTLKFGKTYIVNGTLKPGHASGSKEVRIVAYRYEGQKWVRKRTYTAVASTISGGSRYTKKIKLPSRGTWRLRAHHPKDDHNASSYSTYRKVTVK